jgi:hypothetical protein
VGWQPCLITSGSSCNNLARTAAAAAAVHLMSIMIDLGDGVGCLLVCSVHLRWLGKATSQGYCCCCEQSIAAVPGLTAAKSSQWQRCCTAKRAAPAAAAACSPPVVVCRDDQLLFLSHHFFFFAMLSSTVMAVEQSSCCWCLQVPDHPVCQWGGVYSQYMLLCSQPQ